MPATRPSNQRVLKRKFADVESEDEYEESQQEQQEEEEGDPESDQDSVETGGRPSAKTRGRLANARGRPAKARGRPAKADEDKGADSDIIDAFKKLPHRVSEPLKEFVRNYSDRVERAAKWQKQRRLLQPLDSDGIHPAVPRPVFDQYWSQEDEDELSQDWATERSKWEHPPSLEGVYRALWSLCLKFMSCTPFDIVGVKTGFAFTRQRVGRYSFGADSCMFSMVFCCAMNPLVTHPIWDSSVPGGAAKHLVMALQYAVILRTNDQRPWKGIQPIGPFLHWFKLVADRQVGLRPIHEQHKEARRRMGDLAVALDPISRVFRALEKNIKGAKKPMEGDHPYYIITQDLKDVAAALDEMLSLTGLPVLPTNLAYATLTEPKVHSDPPSKKQFPVWQELAMKDQVRWLRRQANIPETDVSEADGSETHVSQVNDPPIGTPRVRIVSDDKATSFQHDDYTDFTGGEPVDTGDELGEGQEMDIEDEFDGGDGEEMDIDITSDAARAGVLAKSRVVSESPAAALDKVTATNGKSASRDETPINSTFKPVVGDLELSDEDFDLNQSTTQCSQEGDSGDLKSDDLGAYDLDELYRVFSQVPSSTLTMGTLQGPLGYMSAGLRIPEIHHAFDDRNLDISGQQANVWSGTFQ
ncbi:hypothetical protein QQZ08_007174 [Neonectria magnoliae]|uniref:Uncharacterized protein n=1 Tax=Neonectria magnoliae TaxID=2732573 RepID=A0ABR1HZM3_9HYPO